MQKVIHREASRRTKNFDLAIKQVFFKALKSARSSLRHEEYIIAAEELKFLTDLN